MRMAKALVISLLFCGAAPVMAQTWTISVTTQSVVPMNNGGVGAAELSGLTWAGGNQYYAVSDNDGNMFPMTINIDPATGRVVSHAFAPPIQLAGGIDVEGIVYDADSGSVLISDETGPAIREHGIADGSLLQAVNVPPVFATHRSNLSLESLSLQSDGSALWTANEEALSGDGPVSSFSNGTVVRLQKFDAARNPIGQWAYITDPISGDIGNNGRDIEVSGVADLVALPDGNLVVLERALGATPFGFRMRLYLVDFEGATDVSALPALAGQSYTPAAKTLLRQVSFSGFNMEGIALGPKLADKSYSLLMVSDNGSGAFQGLYALTIAPPICHPTPLSGCRVARHSSLLFRRNDGDNDRLTWNWRGGTVADLGVYGDPLTPGGTDYTLCIYDSPAGVSSFAWAGRVRAGAGWSDARGRGFRYADKTGAASGVTGIQLRTGDGNARINMRGKGLSLQTPDNGTAPMLNLDSTVVVQLVNSDDPLECFAATYSAARESTADQFKARY
jgi:hypothetical protein